MIMKMSDLSKIITSVVQGKKLNHRRMVVITGDNDVKIISACANLVKSYSEFVRKNPRILYTYQIFYEDGIYRRNLFKKELGSLFEVDYVPYHESQQVLGATYDIAVLDLINDLRPNDLGRLTGIIAGGGLLILLTPRFEEWDKIITRFQENLLTPQYGVDKLRHIFVKRFIQKLFVHKGITIYDADREKFLKEPEILEKLPEQEKRELLLPEKALFPLKVYSLALTQDQVEVLHLLELLYERPKGKLAIVITADRGRGKSCALGIGLAALAHKLRRRKGRARILVTAPSEMNVQSLFELAQKTLEVLKHSVEVEKKGDLKVALKAKGIDIEYYKPLDCIGRSADIIAVDEAAGLQVPMLYKIHRTFSRAVFSSTIHGYEGAGRGFSVRFLGALREDPETTIYEYEMHEPIRYAENDPIEIWSFDTLMLDAEPASLDKDDLEDIAEGRIEYYKPDIYKFFLEQENEAKQFIGIYIMAHYRNNCDDLGMIMDAPHHTIRALRTTRGKILTAVELAEEGSIPDTLIPELIKGGWIAGNIIPDRLLKHYKLIEFAKLTGWRIVRIATHPQVMRKGLGSRALSEICREAVERGYDWVGAGFGVNEPLLRFWIRNHFIPVHISPDRNPVSGEYTVIVVRPLTETAEEQISIANREFRLKLINSLCEPYHDLEPKIALMLIKSTKAPVFEDYSPALSDIQKHRIKTYAEGYMTLENCMDCAFEMAKTYFYNVPKNIPELAEDEELLLITRILQAKSWRLTCEELGLAPPFVMTKIREIIGKLVEYYL
ncbi:MAG: tRNA(Met) cytidine acetyltransferase [Thermoprotei archaeon]|nr:MAG: tRNA(Met) cytidine acetyltransferase [Thermoprotei archaeon]